MPSFDEFRAAIKNGGLTRSNRFTVRFSLPAGLQVSPYFTQIGLRQIMLFCSRANIPALSLSTAPTRTSGEVRNVPYDRNFEPLTLSFYADKGMNAKFLFDEWINLVQDRNTRQFAYWDEYVIPSMTVTIEDLDDSAIYEVEFFDIYPKTVNSIELDYSNSSVMVINVVMEYRYWLSKRIVSGEELEYFRPDRASLAPNEMFVTIQGSSIPGVAQKISNGVATAFVPGVTSILSTSADGLVTDVGTRLSELIQVPATAATGAFTQDVQTLYDTVYGNLTQVGNMAKSAVTSLASPAGLNIAPSDLRELSGMYNVARQAFGSSSNLAGVIANGKFSVSSPDALNKVSAINAEMNSHISKVQSIQSKIATGIEASVNTISQFGFLIAPNTPRGQ
jgi:hypothetical protein